MRSTNRKRVLLVSGSVILLCLTIIVGMTFALFTDTEIVNNHLQAGDLDITLVRTKLTSTYLTERGFLDTVTDSTECDFTNDKSENVFGLEDTLIVPLSEYTAEMKLTNNSDVAFKYWIKIVTTDGTDADLAEQLEVTVTSKNDATKTATVMLSDGLLVGSETDPVGTLAVGDSGEFTVSVKFIDDRTTQGMDNDKAQGDDVYFDLIVYAVQETTDPSAS